MNIKVNTAREQLCLEITVQTYQPSRIRLKVYDYERPKTVFTDRFKDIAGKQVFYVRMPISSKNVVVSVYNEANGNLRANQDKSFELLDIDKIPLQKRMNIKVLNDVRTRAFIDFAQRFAYNASYLKGDQVYVSPIYDFTIEYKNGKLTSGRTGKQLATPARINKTDANIQVSKALFDDYTVPMRMAILLHEYAHFYMNRDIDNEREADRNGLLLYLALGYPRIEGLEAYLEVFMDTPSMQNKDRYDRLNKFIGDFENNKILGV